MCGWALKASRASAPARSNMRAKPAVVNCVSRSDVNTKGATWVPARAKIVRLDLRTPGTAAGRDGLYPRVVLPILPAECPVRRIGVPVEVECC